MEKGVKATRDFTLKDIFNMTKSKRSQITVFIILGVVIVLSAILVYYSLQSDVQSNLEKEFGSDAAIKTNIRDLQGALVDCMEQKTREALKRIGVQGGYYNKPVYYSDQGWAFIPHYYYQGLLLAPQKTRVESELSAYVNDNFPKCVDDLNIQSFQLTAQDPKTTTTISKGKVKFVIDMPLNVKREDKSTTINLANMPVYYNSSLFDILEVADFMTRTHAENKAMFCLNCVVDMAKERNLYVDMMDFDARTTLVTITENYTSTQPYLFEFLNSYG